MACTGTTSGSTFTLTANCDTTVQLTVPDGVTVNGGGFTITARDPSPATSFSGAVLTNDPAGHSMTIENLTIQGMFVFNGSCPPLQAGIFFNDASGSVTGVTVNGITQHSACQVGYGVLSIAEAGVARTITVTNSVVTGYNKNGLVARGMTTMNVSASTIGPPDILAPSFIAQNGVVYGGVGGDAGAGGSLINGTVVGDGFGSSLNESTAVLLFGAKGVTLLGDTITGAGTDVGVDVVNNSTGAVITRNQVGRTAPDVPDTFGIGVSVEAGSTATLTCNTFSGWKTNVEGVPPQPPCITAAGYWMAVSDGGVFTFGAAPFQGSLAGIHLNAPVVGVANTPAGGYWLGASDGGVFSFGAPFFGSLGGHPLHAPVVGIAAAPDGGGYYLVAADGGVFTFGDAGFHGSTGNIHLNAPVVGIAVTPDNQGYYLVAADGGVFTFGDAGFQGSMGGMALNKPVVGIAVDAATSGYWLVAADGGVFTFGAPFLGSTGNIHLNAPVVGMAATATGVGYRLVASDGGVFCFGAAPFVGSTGGSHLNKPVVGITSTGA
jgi:hypothetical protein